MSPDDEDPFEGLDEDEYLPPESDVDPEEDLDVGEEPEEEPEEAEEEPPEEPPEGEEPSEPEDEEPSEPEEPPEGEPTEEPSEEPEDEEGVMRIPPAAGPEGGEDREPDAGAGDSWGGLDDDAYVPPESDVDPEEHLDVDGEPDEEAGGEPEPVEPDPLEDRPEAEAEPGEAEPAEAAEEPEPKPEEAEPTGRTPERPPEEDLRIEDVLQEEQEEPVEPAEPEGPPPGDEGPVEEDEGGPLPAGAGVGDEEVEEEPAYPGPPEPGDPEPDLPEEEPGVGEPEEEAGTEPWPEPEAGEAPHEGEPETGEGPPAGPPGEGPEREPADEPAPDLPGVGAVVVAEALDGLGSRRVAGTILGLAAALVAAAYWRGLSDAGWFLRTAFVLTPTLLLPAYAYRFPAERRTGHARVLATYPPGPGRFLAGRYLALLLLGLVYLVVALAIAGPVAWYAGPHWVQQLPRHVGVGALVVLATASSGVLLGTLLGSVRGRVAGAIGLVLAALWYLAPQGVYRAEALLDGTGYGTLAVRALHLSPAVPGTALLTEAQLYPVLASDAVEAAALAGMALLFLALGALAYVWLQGPGGWRVHPVLVALFGLLTLGALASPLAVPADLDRGDVLIEDTRASNADVTLDVDQDLRGASGGRPVERHLTQGVRYSGFLELDLSRQSANSSRTLRNVTVDVRAPVLGVDGTDDVGSVTVPAAGNGSREVPVDVEVAVASVPGAYRPVDATAFVEVTSDEVGFTAVVDDLATAASSGPLVRYVPAAVAAGVAVIQGAALVVARRQV